MLTCYRKLGWVQRDIRTFECMIQGHTASRDPQAQHVFWSAARSVRARRFGSWLAIQGSQSGAYAQTAPHSKSPSLGMRSSPAVWNTNTKVWTLPSGAKC